MKAFIVSLNRAKSIKTHKYFKDSKIEWYIILHNQEQEREYLLANPEIPVEKFIYTDVEYNISAQRNWIIENLMDEGEWALMMDDNIEKFNVFPEPYYYAEKFDNERKDFRIPFESNYPPVERFEEVILETIHKAEEIGTSFCGFATIENYFFRSKKWKTISMICSKACLIQKTELRYDENIRTMDDYNYSVKCLLRHGKVLVNAYVWPKATHNNPGGLGKLSERAPLKIEDCKTLINSYPGLFRYKDRKNSVPMAEICLRSYGQPFIENWVKSHASN